MGEYVNKRSGQKSLKGGHLRNRNDKKKPELKGTLGRSFGAEEPVLTLVLTGEYACYVLRMI